MAAEDIDAAREDRDGRWQRLSTSADVDVAFHELSADGLYTDGKPASPVLVSGWVRDDPRQSVTNSILQQLSAQSHQPAMDLERQT